MKSLAAKISFITAAALFLPLFAFAQSNSCSSGLNTVADIFNFFTCLIAKTFIPLLFALALIVFIYGVLKYMMNASDETKREEGRQFMLWGIVALFVMFSVWGLVGVLRNTFSVGNVIPQLPH